MSKVSGILIFEFRMQRNGMSLSGQVWVIFSEKVSFQGMQNSLKLKFLRSEDHEEPEKYFIKISKKEISKKFEKIKK